MVGRPGLVEDNGVASYQARSCQRGLELLEETCLQKGLKINEKKTQMISISKGKKCKSWLKTKDGSTIHSASEMKPLGFVFSESPDCNEQVSNLIKKTSKRKYLLCYYSKFLPGNDLKKIYCSLVRSLLEYSAVTFTTQISKYQCIRLENIQKQCLKIMYSHGYGYSELLEMSGLESLKKQREKLFGDFADKIVKNPTYSHLFPLNNTNQVTRNSKKHKELSLIHI